jgi:hypothetical protein
MRARPAPCWLGLVLALLFLPAARSPACSPTIAPTALYHRYEGGGVTIHGPSVLVRKKFAEKYALSANYYQDM